MKVNVAGAGAGKTTKMAELITGADIPAGKIVFCIAFTNAAAANIEEKLMSRFGEMPDNIRTSTIHSFLYQELIKPYYYFLYGKQYERLSVIDLPDNIGFRQIKLSELEADDILHYTKIPERAKWVAYQKSGDTRAIKDARARILKRFSDYCAAIYVDEAQDISGDVRHILEALDAAGVEMILCGDPKQDVKGLGQFREIIKKTDDVNYIAECHRCPRKHLNLSNRLAPEAERQVAADDNAYGGLTIVFESEIADIKSFLAEENYGLRYISSRRDRFDTHEKREGKNRFENLYHEVHVHVLGKWKEIKPEIEVERAAFYITECMLQEYDDGKSASEIIKKWVKTKAFDELDKKKYAQMIAAFDAGVEKDADAIVVSSIEKIKGLEAERCLFILTTDLASYLFGDKTEDNKTSHLCYVALTRSLDNLTILITKEVEEKYTRATVQEFFEQYA